MIKSSQPLRSGRVFLDSSSLLSLVNVNDIHHQQARKIWNQITKERWGTFTTNFIIAETHSLFLIRLGQKAATLFLRKIIHSKTTIERVSPQDEKRACSIIFQYDDKDFSLADATSFIIMERLNISYAFTFDRHFEEYGLTVI